MGKICLANTKHKKLECSYKDTARRWLSISKEDGPQKNLRTPWSWTPRTRGDNKFLLFAPSSPLKKKKRRTLKWWQQSNKASSESSVTTQASYANRALLQCLHAHEYTGPRRVLVNQKRHSTQRKSYTYNFGGFFIIVLFVLLYSNSDSTSLCMFKNAWKGQLIPFL